mmetsp:Transcript_103567/g.198803  ORF Transcript_103567/g.198803 Transcript_103567/m.198803 type:complete len:183 (+) Transcript_103567:2-550(+)
MSGRAGGRGSARASREPPKDTGPQKDIGCKCGYTCGTMKALEKHLDKFKGNPAHEAQVKERPPSPPRPVPQGMPGMSGFPGDLPPGMAEQLSRGGGYPMDLPPGMAEQLGLLGGDIDDLPPGVAERLLGMTGAGREPVRSAAGAGNSDDVEIGCICGYTCGTAKALQRHLDKFSGNASHGKK